MLCEKAGIIVACDVSSLAALEKLLAATAAVREVTAYKLGFSLSLRYGLPRVVRVVKRHTKKPVIYDHQKAGTDIPQMGEPFAEVCAQAGIDGVIFFPHAGPATLEAFLDATLARSLTPIVGAVMTHPRFLATEGGFVVEEAPQMIYRTALGRGVQHYVLPATKPACAAILKTEAARARMKGLVVMSPGVGRQQADIMAVRNVMRGINWSPIIGSAIYQADDPALSARQLASELGLSRPIRRQR